MYNPSALRRRPDQDVANQANADRQKRKSAVRAAQTPPPGAPVTPTAQTGVRSLRHGVGNQNIGTPAPVSPEAQLNVAETPPDFAPVARDPLLDDAGINDAVQDTASLGGANQSFSQLRDRVSASAQDGVFGGAQVGVIPGQFQNGAQGAPTLIGRGTQESALREQQRQQNVLRNQAFQKKSSQNFVDQANRGISALRDLRAAKAGISPEELAMREGRADRPKRSLTHSGMSAEKQSKIRAREALTEQANLQSSALRQKALNSDLDVSSSEDQVLKPSDRIAVARLEETTRNNAFNRQLNQEKANTAASAKQLKADTNRIQQANTRVVNGKKQVDVKAAEAQQSFHERSRDQGHQDLQKNMDLFKASEMLLSRNQGANALFLSDSGSEGGKPPHTGFLSSPFQGERLPSVQDATGALDMLTEFTKDGTVAGTKIDATVMSKSDRLHIRRVLKANKMDVPDWLMDIKKLRE